MVFKNLLELQNYFSDELKAVQYLEQQRWNGAPECPHCGSEHFYRTQTRFRNPALKEYKDFVCKACSKKYTVFTGTIYESSKISMRLWYSALYLLSAHRKGISSLQLGRDLGVTQKTAWYMLHRIREMLVEKAPEVLVGEVALDETFVGGKNKNRHKDKKVEKSTGRAFKDKTPVLGMLQKGGKVKCVVVKDTKAKTIQPLVLSNIQPGSIICTDEWGAYKGLNSIYEHYVVDHGRGQYKTGEFTTNALEGFWSHLKRSIIGIYHYVSRKHLQRYCEEIAYRYNYRHLTDIERFEFAVKKCGDARLLYKVLTR